MCLDEPELLDVGLYDLTCSVFVTGVCVGCSGCSGLWDAMDSL